MSVYLFDIWKTRPVYHAYGRIRLQEKQARLFARPCGKCFDVRL